MAWKNSVITEAGERLLAEMMNGDRLIITRIEIGSGIVPVEELIAQTGIVEPITAPALLSGEETTDDGKGKVIKIQIRNDGVSATTRMRQIGIFAKTEQTDEILFILLQDETGEEIPAYDEFPQFDIEQWVTLEISSTKDIVINISPLAYATSVDFSELEKRVDKLENAKGITVVQTTGDSTEDVMSQNAVSTAIVNVKTAIDETISTAKNELNKEITKNKINVVQTTGESETDVMSQKAVTDALNEHKGVNVVQETGDSETDVMSQKAVTEALKSGGGTSINVVQTTGDSTEDVMSQNAVTVAIEASHGSGNVITKSVNAHADGQENTINASDYATAHGHKNSLDGSAGGTAMGEQNQVNGSATGAAIGSQNTVASSDYAIAGGYKNTVTGSQGGAAFGEQNSVQSSADGAAIGNGNQVSGCNYSSVGIGYQNKVLGGNSSAALGNNNEISGGQTVTIVGGSNAARACEYTSIIGYSNILQRSGNSAPADSVVAGFNIQIYPSAFSCNFVAGDQHRIGSSSMPAGSIMNSTILGSYEQVSGSLNHCAIMGYGNTVSNLDDCTILGYYNEVTSDSYDMPTGNERLFVFGANNKIKNQHYYGVAVGFNNTIQKNASINLYRPVVIGTENKCEGGTQVVLVGNNLISQHLNYTTVVGWYNADIGSGEYGGAIPYFVVGNGWGESNRHNAIVVTTEGIIFNGDVQINGNLYGTDTSGTTTFIAANCTEGIVTVTETSGHGDKNSTFDAAGSITLYDGENKGNGYQWYLGWKTSAQENSPAIRGFITKGGKNFICGDTISPVGTPVDIKDSAGETLGTVVIDEEYNLKITIEGADDTFEAEGFITSFKQ